MCPEKECWFDLGDDSLEVASEVVRSCMAPHSFSGRLSFFFQYRFIARDFLLDFGLRFFYSLYFHIYYFIFWHILNLIVVLVQGDATNMVKIDMVVCPGCHLKTNSKNPLCVHCGKNWSALAVNAGKQINPLTVRPAFRYGEQLVH